MSERSTEKSCAMIGVVCLLAVNLAAAEITLLPGESCASASCHSDKFQSSVPHDGGPGAQFCGVCHVAEEPGEHGFRFAASGGKLCTQCHAALIRHEHKHAPASSGLCTFCHSAHKSQYAGQLKFPPEALCVSCHNKTVPDGALTVHGPVEQGRCTACHDPHSSSHDFQLVEAVPRLCFGCHDQDQTDHEGRTLPGVEESFIDKSLRQHPPFARGDCLLCHDPHASDSIRLQRRSYPSAFYNDFSSESYFCLMCHGEATFAEPRTLTATKFRNGNLNLHYRHVVRDKGRGCRACHHQHASNLEAQIATDAYLGERDVGIKSFAKTETGGTCEPLCHRPVQYDRMEPVNITFMVTPREGVDATPAELKRASKEHDGRTLFLQRCAGCHGADAGGKIGPPIRGATMERILAATERVDLMSDLASLDPKDLHAIVDYLPAGTAVVAPAEGVTDGTVLFSTNCAGCHGADANGSIGPAIRGATGAMIREAVGRVPMMIAMKSLSAESIEAIGDYLGGLGGAAPAAGDAADEGAPDGKVVYAMNCRGCHGPDSNGQLGPSIRGASPSDVSEAIGRVPMMAGLKSLGSADIVAVGEFLTGLAGEKPFGAATATVDGRTIYATRCSPCHGDDAGGHIGPDIRGHTADDVRTATGRVPMMAGIKSIAAIEIDAVGKFIQGLADAAPAAATAAAPDGEALFKEHCAACHGRDATGLVGPDITLASMDDITAAIEQVPMMIATRVLGAKEIKATADYLTEIRQ